MFIQLQTISIILSLGFSFAYCNPLEKKSENNSDLLFLAIASSASSSTTNTECPPKTLPSDVNLANEIVSAPGASSREFGDPSKAINGICGSGEFSGSLDIYELEAIGIGASLILSWKNKRVMNSSGVDFIIFENAFRNQGATTYFVEPIAVDVSEDNVNYCGFTPSFGGGGTATQNREDWRNFAGLTPVLYNMNSNLIPVANLFDNSIKQASGSSFFMGTSGGDGFDLDSTDFGSGCTVGQRNAIRTNGFVYIRMRSSQSQGFVAPLGVFRQSSDIDGVIAKSTTTR
jgi:hypothetical protein